MTFTAVMYVSPENVGMLLVRPARRGDVVTTRSRLRVSRTGEAVAVMAWTPSMTGDVMLQVAPGLDIVDGDKLIVIV